MPIEYKNTTLYTLEEVSEILKIAVVTLRDYLKKNKINGKKIGKRWYIDSQEIERFLK